MVENTLEQRGEVYGSYEANIKAVSNIMNELQKVHKDKTGESLNLIDYTNLNYLVIKLVRLGATPEHIDSYHDLQGYAKLSEDYYSSLKAPKESNVIKIRGENGEWETYNADR